MGEEGGDLPHYMELFLKVHCADRLTPKPAQPAGPPPQCPPLASRGSSDTPPSPSHRRAMGFAIPSTCKALFPDLAKTGSSLFRAQCQCHLLRDPPEVVSPFALSPDPAGLPCPSHRLQSCTVVVFLGLRLPQQKGSSWGRSLTAPVISVSPVSNVC